MNISFLYRKFRKSIASFTLLTILASFVSFAGVAQAFDDTSGHWGEDYIDQLVADGVIDDATSFYPDMAANRAEYAKIAVLAFLEESDLDASYDAGFSDVDSDAWYAIYVNTAAKHGIISGDTDADGNPTGYFRPGDNLNRAEASKIIKNAAGLTTDTAGGPHFDDVEESDWFYDYVETLYNSSVVDGKSEGVFAPGDNVTRAETSKMTVNGQNPVDRVDEKVPAEDGTLSIEAIDMDGGTVPKGATAVQMLGLELTANGADMTLDGLVLNREGVGATADISNVYFYNGATRIGSGHSVSSDTNSVTFSSLGVDVAEGDTVTVWIKTDFSSSATASNEHSLVLADASATTVTGGDADGDFPLSGPTFTLGGSSAGTITIEKNATVSNPTIGQTDAEIANFKLTASNEDMDLEQMALTWKGTVSAEAGANFKLLQNGEVLATADGVDENDLFTFVLDAPYTIEKGDTRTFSVTAEITSKADASDTVRVYLDESTDLVAIGQVYGYGAQVTFTSYDNVANDGTDANWSTIQGGQFTIAYNGPAVKKFAPNSKDVSLLDITFTAGRDVEVRKLTFNLNATGDGLVGPAEAATAANYTDVKLINSETGAILMGPKELSLSGSDSTQDVAFTDSWYLDAGESVDASLTVDAANQSTLDADTIYAILSAVSTTEGVKDAGTGEFLTDIVPSTAITGATHTLQTASLTASLASTPVSDTIVKGSSKATLAGFVFSAGDASDVTMTAFSPTVAFSTNSASTSGSWVVSGASGTTQYAKNIVTTLYLYDSAGNQLGTSEAVGSNGKSTFDGFELTVSAGSTQTVYVKGDISTTAPIDSDSDHVGIDIEATGDVTAQDEDQNSVTLAAADTNGAIDTDATTVDMTISSAGTIVVSNPSSQVEDQLVAAGSSSSVLVGSFKVKSTDEDFKVKKIGLDIATAAAADSFKTLSIKFPTSTSAPTTLDGSASQDVSTGTGITFSNLEFMVPADNDNVVFEIYAVPTAHGDDTGGAADTGDSLKVLLNNFAADFEAEGMGSHTTKDGDDSGVLASSQLATNNPYIFKSVPTVTVSSASSNSMVYGTDTEVFRFNVAANANGDLTIAGLKLDVAFSGIVTGSTGLGGNGAVAATNDLYTAGGTALGNKWKMYEVVSGSINYATQVGSGAFLFASTTNFTNHVIMDVLDNTGSATSGFEKISASSNRTYVVTATLLDDGTVNTNSVSVRIGNDSSSKRNRSIKGINGYNFVSTGDLASSGMIWSDRPNVSYFGTGEAGTASTASTASTSDMFWHNGYKVTGLPTSYVTYSD